MLPKQLYFLCTPTDDGRVPALEVRAWLRRADSEVFAVAFLDHVEVWDASWLMHRLLISVPVPSAEQLKLGWRDDGALSVSDGSNSLHITVA